MSKRRVLLQHQKRLNEIHSIINAMKNLAFLETRKLNHSASNLQTMALAIASTIEEFNHYFPEANLANKATNSIWIVLGSERGFCGDYNERLLYQFNRRVTQTSRIENPVIVVGSRLATLFNSDHQTFNSDHQTEFNSEHQTDSANYQLTAIPGASVAEEISSVLTNIIDEIKEFQSQLNSHNSPASIRVLFHDLSTQQITDKDLLQPFQPQSAQASWSISTSEPPLIQLPPINLYSELIQHYFFTALQGVITNSLLFENQLRIQHMEGASQHIEKKSLLLSRRNQQLRQEEITEEIELIILKDL